jgi:ABC-type transporter Mla subunit MlaD
LSLGVLVAGCAPDDIARSTCRSEMLATGDPWACTIEGERVGRVSSLEFDTESRNHVAQVKLALAVTKGTLRVGYRDLAGEKHLTITPESPAAMAMQTRLHRERRSFTLFFEPVGGDVEGLRGTVNYLTP